MVKSKRIEPSEIAEEIFGRVDDEEDSESSGSSPESSFSDKKKYELVENSYDQVDDEEDSESSGSSSDSDKTKDDYGNRVSRLKRRRFTEEEKEQKDKDELITLYASQRKVLRRLSREFGEYMNDLFWFNPDKQTHSGDYNSIGVRKEMHPYRHFDNVNKKNDPRYRYREWCLHLIFECNTVKLFDIACFLTVSLEDATIINHVYRSDMAWLEGLNKTLKTRYEVGPLDRFDLLPKPFERWRDFYF